MRWMESIGLAAVLTGLMVAGSGTQKAAAQASPAEQADKYTWLEDIRGDKPMAWVKAENARTAAVRAKQMRLRGTR